MPLEIKRGEIYRVDWNPRRGSEQGGGRPALVIQNDTGNKFGSTTIVASCSTKITRSFPFVVHIKARDSGLPADCAVDLGQIMTIDKSRLLRKCGKLSQARMDEVDKAIKISLNVI
jgi:mRNA interferase MazF